VGADPLDVVQFIRRTFEHQPNSSISIGYQSLMHCRHVHVLVPAPHHPATPAARPSYPPMYEVKTGEGDKSEQVHENRNAHESRRRRRARWRRHHGGSVTVWADNKPVKQQYLDEIKHAEREESD
jgi:hypothetical protein